MARGVPRRKRDTEDAIWHHAPKKTEQKEGIIITITSSYFPFPEVVPHQCHKIGMEGWKFLSWFFVCFILLARLRKHILCYNHKAANSADVI